MRHIISTKEDEPLLLNGIQIDDPDIGNGSIIAPFACKNGRIMVNLNYFGVDSINHVVVQNAQDETGTYALTLSGHLDLVNSVLRNVEYTPFHNFVGVDLITTTATDSSRWGRTISCGFKHRH